MKHINEEKTLSFFVFLFITVIQSVEPVPTELSSAVEEVSVPSESVYLTESATASLTESMHGEEAPAKKKNKSKAKAKTRGSPILFVFIFVPYFF